MHDAPSSLAAAADAILRTRGYNLADWIADRRDEGASFRTIAGDLEALTDGVVVASHQTIVRWVNHYDDRTAA